MTTWNEVPRGGGSATRESTLVTDLVPDEDGAHDIGSATKRIKKVWAQEVSAESGLDAATLGGEEPSHYAPQSDVDALEEEFDGATGHKHTGEAGDAPKLDSANIDFASAVSGFAPDNVKAALDALAGGRIVDMTTNSNGTYVRWENGLQVCLVVTAAAQGNAAQGLWTFPAPFTSILGFFGSSMVPSSGSWHPSSVIWGSGTGATTDANWYLLQEGDTTASTAGFDAIFLSAFGMWK